MGYDLLFKQEKSLPSQKVKNPENEVLSEAACIQVRVQSASLIYVNCWQ